MGDKLSGSVQPMHIAHAHMINDFIVMYEVLETNLFYKFSYPKNQNLREGTIVFLGPTGSDTCLIREKKYLTKLASYAPKRNSLGQFGGNP